MPSLVPVDHNPFAAPQQPRLVPVEHNPFGTSWDDVNQQALENMPSSVAKRGQEFVNMFTPEGIGSMGDVIGGAIQHAGAALGLPGDQEMTPQKQAASAALDQIKEPYTSMENFKHTLATDPTRIPMDALTFAMPARAPLVASKAARIAEAVPSVAKLDKVAKQGYKSFEKSGHVFPAKEYNALVDDIGTHVAEKGGHPSLTPNTIAVVKDLAKNYGRDLSAKDMQTLREIASTAQGAARDKDRMLAGVVKKKIDAFIADKIPEFAEANKNYARAREGERIENLIAKGERKGRSWWTGAGPENAIRRQFDTVASNDKKMRTFTPPVQKAIEDVAMGTRGGNAARWVGKFAPTSPLAVTQGTSAAILGHLAAPGTGAAIAPALWAGGMIGRKIATRGTRNRAAKASALARSGGELPKVRHPDFNSRIAAALYEGGLLTDERRNRGQY
jgi:hypothetical protein